MLSLRILHRLSGPGIRYRNTVQDNLFPPHRGFVRLPTLNCTCLNKKFVEVIPELRQWVGACDLAAFSIRHKNHRRRLADVVIRPCGTVARDS